MTDSDDSAFPQLIPPSSPAAATPPASPDHERPARSLAELAEAEGADDPDDPPLASPDDVMPATSVEPALAVPTQVLGTSGFPAAPASEPDAADTLDPAAAARLSAALAETARPGSAADPLADALSGGGFVSAWGGGASGITRASAPPGATPSSPPSSPTSGASGLGASGGAVPAPPGEASRLTELVRRPARSGSVTRGEQDALPALARESTASAAARDPLATPPHVREPTSSSSARDPLAPSRERTGSAAARDPFASPARDPLAAPLRQPTASAAPRDPLLPSVPPGAGSAPPSSVWKMVGPEGRPPADAPEPRSLLGSASSMTSPAEVLARSTASTRPGALPARAPSAAAAPAPAPALRAADEHDTLGIGIPAVPTATLPLSTASPLAAELAASSALGDPSRAAAPSNTTKVTAAQVVDARRLPEATTLRDAPPVPLREPAVFGEPARDTFVTAAAVPYAGARRPDDQDTIGVAAPPPHHRGSPPRNSGSQLLGWIALASIGGLALGGGCVACLGGGAGRDPSDGGNGPHVAVVELSGPITDGAATVRELRRFTRQGDIQAIVVRIDSPGGAVAPSQEIFDAMRAASEKKPVVVSMGTVAASGGFWAAMAGDWIVASPGSITGSIGVISQMPDLRGLAELLRIDLKTYKSGPYKDAGNPLRAPAPGDEAVHMELISDVYDQFVTVISERRHIELDAVRRFADGRIFTGRRAHELGLVDQLGGLYDAAHHALVMAEERRAKAANEQPEPVEDEPTLIYPRRPGPSLLRLLSEEAGEGAASGAGRAFERVLDAAASEPRVELR